MAYEPGFAHARPEFATVYDRYRPSPPTAIVDLLTQYRGVERPRLVVDLGSGTGLSTVIWSGRAERVIGVDPAEGMQSAARAAPGVEYRRAPAEDTRLPDACADVVTASQSFHWMDRDRTLAEVSRLLVSGGVFAAYFHYWPPAIHPDVDEAFAAVRRAAGAPENALRGRLHLDGLDESGCFRYVRAVALHGRTEGGVDDVMGLALALGPVAHAVDAGEPGAVAAVDRLRAVAHEVLADRRVPFWWSYHLTLGVA